MPTLGSVLHEKLILSHPLILCTQCTSNIYLEWKKHPFKIFTHFCGEKKNSAMMFYVVILFCKEGWDFDLYKLLSKYKIFFTAFIPQTFCFFSSFEKPEKFIKYKKNVDIKKKWREERIKRVVCAWAKWLLPPFPSGSLFQFPQHELTRSVITLPWIGCQSIKRLLLPPNSPEFHQVFMTIFWYQLTVGSKKLIGIKVHAQPQDL